MSNTVQSSQAMNLLIIYFISFLLFCSNFFIKQILLYLLYYTLDHTPYHTFIRICIWYLCNNFADNTFFIKQFDGAYVLYLWLLSTSDICSHQKKKICSHFEHINFSLYCANTHRFSHATINKYVCILYIRRKLKIGCSVNNVIVERIKKKHVKRQSKS